MKKFFLAISTHKLFGLIFLPCLGEESNGQWINVEMLSDLNPLEGLYGIEEEIVAKALQYTDREIVQRFGKRKETVKVFYQRVDKEYITLHIRPYIEKRMWAIYTLALREECLFYRLERGTSLYVNDAIRATEAPVQLTFRFVRESDQIRYTLHSTIAGKPIRWQDLKPLVLLNTPCLLLGRKNIYHFAEETDAKKIIPFFSKSEIIIPDRIEREFFKKFLLKVTDRYSIEAEGFEIDEIKGECTMEIHLENNWQGKPLLRPVFRYGKAVVNPTDSRKHITLLAEKSNRYGIEKIYRDAAREGKYLELLQSFGCEPTDHGYFRLMHTDAGVQEPVIKDYVRWCIHHHDVFTREKITVSQARIHEPYLILPPEIQFVVKTGIDWFDLKIEIKAGDFVFPFTELRKNILQNDPAFRLPDGTLFLIPDEWFTRYQPLVHNGTPIGSDLRLERHFASLIPLDEIRDQTVFEEIRQINGMSDPTSFPVPSGLKAQLRDYQQRGFNWLMQLRQYRLNGCLADDMGLGKTLQTLALLCALYDHSRRANGGHGNRQTIQLSLFDDPIEPATAEIVTPNPPPSLLIAPSTLIFNWLNEIRKFAPSLRILVHAGSLRMSQMKNFDRYDVIISTYGIVRMDFKELMKYRFHYLILDEAQLIKNPLSKTYKAMLALVSDHRVTLTGTPVENSLTDLYAQMHFLNRGILGTLPSFKRTYVIPLKKSPSGIQHEMIKSRLHTLILPLLMRRTKAEVLHELPPKTEKTIVCRMTQEQEKLYAEELSKVRNLLIENTEKSRKGTDNPMIIKALGILRQIACHPAMIQPDTTALSGKLEQILRDIRQLVEENHKILVISTYKKYLRLIGKGLEQENISFSVLTGDTQDPESVVTRYTTDGGIPVLLMTLKKGGYGLNLTVADYVLITDPWWNPASQQQGMDRVYRIGQDKPVFVYKYITLGTLEEKILQLQKQKKKVADLFTGTNDPSGILHPQNLRFILQME